MANNSVKDFVIVITDIKTTANVINNVTVSVITKEIKNLLIIFLHYVLKGVDIRASLLEYCFKSPSMVFYSLYHNMVD